MSGGEREGTKVYRFIYVFSQDTADALTAGGIQPLVSDAEKKVWVFENTPEAARHLYKKDFVYSNMLYYLVRGGARK